MAQAIQEASCNPDEMPPDDPPGNDPTDQAGCCESGRGGAGSFVLALGVLGVLVRRRRVRSRAGE